ncbi:MAG: ATP-binding cassette domain-containing protein [Dysosmobacter welbionis]
MVPLMVSATGTAEELSAAAVTRESRTQPKTSLVELRASPVDSAAFVVGVGLTAALLAANWGCFHGRAARCVLFLYKRVGTLTHVDLTIRPGECVLLCGASGCGKTTITKLVNGLISIYGGLR